MSLLLQLSKPAAAAAGKQVVAPSNNSLLHNSTPGGVTTNHAMELNNHMPAYMNDSASDLDMSPGSEEVRSYHHTPPQTTYASCFGLPYQDHNYGAPPPPTPPASPPAPIVQPTPASLMSLSNSAGGKMNGHIDVEDISGITEITTSVYQDPVSLPVDDGMVDDSVTRCVCDFQHDDGYMICCDRCSVWQHVDCMGVDRNNIPENYMCELCDPRRVDKQRAVQIQTRKRKEFPHLFVDTSATESENETKALGIDPTTGKKIKGKKRKDRDKLLSKDKKNNRKFVKRFKEKKDKFKQRPNKFQLKKTKFGAARKPFRKNNKIAPLAPTSLPLSLKNDVKDPYAWESSPVESFEEARINQYSSDVLGILSSKKFNGQHVSDVSPRDQLRVQLCHVSQISMTTKGLEAAEDLSCDRPLIEYKGKVMLREQYDKENVFFKHCHPFVLFYSKFEDLDVCVDASSYGNDARYVRRSCTPNAEVRHYIENGKVHFYICSLKSICNGAEITIPFDYNYQDCNFAVECACTKSSCPITRFHRKVDMSGSQHNKIKRRRMSSKSLVSSPPLPSISSSDEGPKSPAPKSPVRSPPSHSVVKRRKLAPLSPIRTSNKRNLQQNNEHTPAARRRTLSGPKSPANSNHATVSSPKKSELRSPGGQNTSSIKTETEGSPDQSEPQKKMSREERKMEAIMKAFQKMEEREHRRQEALQRIDSTPTSPPANIVKPAVRTKSGKSKSIDESKSSRDHHSREGKDLLKMEPVVVIESTPTGLNGEVQVRGPTLRSSTMPRTKAASKAMPPEIAAMEAAEAAAAAAAAALAASKAPEPLQVQSSSTEVKTKEDEDKYEPPKTRKGKRKRMSSGPARRKSRMSSSASAASSTVDPFSSADESSNHATMSQPPSEATTPTPSGPIKAFHFPKTKKHLMKEWLYEKEHEMTKPLSIRTESLDNEGNNGVASIAPPAEDSVEFVQCLPSPSTNALSHLRRSSMSNCSNTRDAASTAVSSMGSSMGSAKKRWLRKAMCEQPPQADSMSPVPSGSASPNPNSCSNSPGGSPPVAHDFVTPLKKRRMARASMCAELPSFTSAPATPVPESPLAIEHRSVSVGGESTNPENTDFTIPLLNAASLQRSEVDIPNRLPNGFKTPVHLSSIPPGPSAANIFEKMGGSEKIDQGEKKYEAPDVKPELDFLDQNRHSSSISTIPESSEGFIPEVKSERLKEEPSVSVPVVESGEGHWGSREDDSLKVESVESCQNSVNLSPVCEQNISAGPSCASSLSPTRSAAHTTGLVSSPVKSQTCSASVDKQQVDSSVDSCHAEVDTGVRNGLDSSSPSSSNHSHPYHSSHMLTQPDSEVPTCSTVSSNSALIDSTHARVPSALIDSTCARVPSALIDSTCARHVDSDSTSANVRTNHSVVDSDMDTQVDIVSHSEPCGSDNVDSVREQAPPEEQQGVSTASHSQGFEVSMDVVEGHDEEQSSAQVDSSQGSSIINVDHQVGVADSGEPSRGRHQSLAESGESSRGRHQSAADSGEPSQGRHQSAADSGEPSRGRHQSAAESVDSTRSRHQSTADSGESSQGRHQSAAESVDSTRSRHQSTTDNGEPSQGRHQSAAESVDSTRSRHQSTADSGEPSQGRHQSAADSGEPSRGRHQSAAESVDSTRSRHQSAADSVSEQLEELGQADSGQGSSTVHSRSVEAPEGDDVPQQSGADEIEEGEVSEGDEEHVGSSGPVQQQDEIEDGEIVDDSDEERTTGDSPTSSSTNNAVSVSESRVTDGATRDDQAVSCSTDSGVEVSSGEDLNHSAESISDGEVVQSSGITGSGDPNLRRTNSQNQISSSDLTSSHTVSAVSAGISSDSGALPSCSSTDNLVGSSNRTAAGLFSSRLSSSSLTSSSSVEHKEGSSDTEVDSTSSHKLTSRSGIHASRSPADVSSSSSSLGQDSAGSSRFGTFTTRWQAGNAPTSVNVDPIPEEPSSSENHTVSSAELPQASTTFLSSNSASSSNPSSTTNTSPAPQSKKKVSLLEYRKRMKSRSIDESCPSRFSERSSSLPSLPNTTLGAHLRTLRDTLVNKTSSSSTSSKTVVSSSGDRGKKEEKRPVSGRSTPSSSSTSSSSSSSGGRLTPSLPSLPLFSQKSDKGCSGKDESDVRWSINPTAAERLCEHASVTVSLTERLRRDFGIDAGGSDEDDKEERVGQSSGGESPPPPPPPPPPPKPKPSASESKPGQQPNPMVYMPHHTVTMPPMGVGIPPAATGGLPGGQMPLPPPPKPPLNLQQPPPAVSLVPPGLPQPLPPPALSSTVPNNTAAKSGHIPSLLSLPVAPAMSMSHNRVAGNQFDCEDDEVDDLPPPPPPPVALQGFLQQPPVNAGGFPGQPPPAAVGFPNHTAPIPPPVPPAAVAQSFPAMNIPGADPSLHQYNYQPGAQSGPAPSKGKSSKKTYPQSYSNTKYQHH